MRKTIIALLAVSALLAASGTATYFYIMSAGKHSLILLAKEGGFCKLADCSDGLDYTNNFLANEFGLTPRNVQWCIGVDSFAQGQFILGSKVQSLLSEALYLPCNDNGSDDNDSQNSDMSDSGSAKQATHPANNPTDNRAVE